MGWNEYSFFFFPLAIDISIAINSFESVDAGTVWSAQRERLRGWGDSKTETWSFSLSMLLFLFFSLYSFYHFFLPFFILMFSMLLFCEVLVLVLVLVAVYCCCFKCTFSVTWSYLPKYLPPCLCLYLCTSSVVFSTFFFSDPMFAYLGLVLEGGCGGRRLYKTTLCSLFYI